MWSGETWWTVPIYRKIMSKLKFQGIDDYRQGRGYDSVWEDVWAQKNDVWEVQA